MVLSSMQDDLGARVIEAGGADAFLSQEIRNSVSFCASFGTFLQFTQPC